MSPLKLAPPERTGTAGAPVNEASRLMTLAKSPPLRAARLALLPAFRLTYWTPRPVMPVREELGFLLNARRLLGAGAEVGVRDGWFSEVILRRWKGRHLLSVDPWREFGSAEYIDRSNVAQEDHEANLATTRARLERFGNRSAIWRMTSAEAADKVVPASLDFVYLDARHDYESVLEDLEAWADKVRPGGLLCGHDYVDGFFLDGDFGVKSAVDEFFGRRGWKVGATFADPPWPSWYVAVPR